MHFASKLRNQLLTQVWQHSAGKAGAAAVPQGRAAHLVPLSSTKDICETEARGMEPRCETGVVPWLGVSLHLHAPHFQDVSGTPGLGRHRAVSLGAETKTPTKPADQMTVSFLVIDSGLEHAYIALQARVQDQGQHLWRGMGTLASGGVLGPVAAPDL